MRESERQAVNASGFSGPVLALDTTGSLGSVALGFAVPGPAPANVEVRTFEPSNRHSGNLLPAVRGVLEEAEVKNRELALLVATRGPGSFTGLRIGLATIQGFALAAGTAAVGVSSLDAAAVADFLDGGIPLRRLAVVDALRGELFAAVYDQGEPAVPVEGPVRLRPADAGRWARERGVQRICGPAVARYLESIGGSAPGIEVLAERRPLAPAALRLGLETARRGEFTLEPLYLRDPDIHGGREPLPIPYSNPSAVFVRRRTRLGTPEASMKREEQIETDIPTVAGAEPAVRQGPPDVEELIRRHRELDEQLQQLTEPGSLSPLQQHEAAVMKKRKLALKDRIAALAATS